MATHTAAHQGVVPCPAPTNVRPGWAQPTATEPAGPIRSNRSAGPAGLNGSPRAVAARPRPVVAVVLEWRGHILLLRRSTQVAHDQGKWHCVTGYIEAGHSAVQQAADELYEETGLRLVDLTSFTAGPVLALSDEAGQSWPVHTFTASTLHKRLTLNWEHDTYRWVLPQRLRRFDGRVIWLDAVICAARDGE